MGPNTPTLRGRVQGSKVLVIGRHLEVLVVGGMLVLAPSTLVYMARQVMCPGSGFVQAGIDPRSKISIFFA